MPSISRGSDETPRETARKLDRDSPHADDRGDLSRQGAVGPGGVIPRRADFVHGAPHCGELGTDAVHPVSPAVAQRCPFCVESSADLVLKASVLLVQPHEVALGLGLDLRHPPPVRLDGLACGLCLGGLDVDHPLSINLVDLADLVIALGLADLDRPTMAFLGALHVIFVPGGDPLAFLGIAGFGLRAAVGGQPVGIGQ